MKKAFFILFLLLLVLVAAPSVSSDPTIETILAEPASSEAVFRFPASLKTVGDNAFSGTVIEKAVFQSELETVGSSAFANTRNLTDVYLPSSVEYIAENAFERSDALTIHGAEGSYAQQWAQAHGIAFEAEEIRDAVPNFARARRDIWKLVNLLRIILFAALLISLTVYFTDERRLLRPRLRPEMHPLDYRFP